MLQTQADQKHLHQLTGPLGGLGSKFLINTDELKETLLTQGYTNEIFSVNTFVATAASFNLGVSALWACTVLQETRNQFVLNIAKTKLRENYVALSRVYRSDGPS